MSDKLCYHVVLDVEPDQLAAKVSRLLSAGCENCGGLSAQGDRLCQAVIFRGTAVALTERVRKTSLDDAKAAQLMLREIATAC